MTRDSPRSDHTAWKRSNFQLFPANIFLFSDVAATAAGAASAAVATGGAVDESGARKTMGDERLDDVCTGELRTRALQSLFGMHGALELLLLLLLLVQLLATSTRAISLRTTRASLVGRLTGLVRTAIPLCPLRLSFVCPSVDRLVGWFIPAFLRLFLPSIKHKKFSSLCSSRHICWRHGGRRGAEDTIAGEKSCSMFSSDWIMYSSRTRLALKHLNLAEKVMHRFSYVRGFGTTFRRSQKRH